MKRNFRLIALLLAVLTASGAAVACSGPGGSGGAPSSSEGSSSAAESSEPVALSGEITVASWNVGADSLKEIGEAYMAKNPGTTITVQYVDGNYEKLRPALAAGNGVPDVFSTQKADFPAFMNTYGDVFADVTDILGPEKDNFAAEAISQVEKDGKYYAFPWDLGPCGLFYHVPTFKELEIDPLSLSTWDKYLEAARTVKAQTGKYMWATSFNGTSTVDEAMVMLHEQGGQYYGADGKVNLANDEMIKAYDVLLRMKADGTIFDIPDAWNDRIKALVDGNLVALPYSVWFTGTMVTSVENGAGEWAFAPMPAFEEGKNMVCIGGSVNAIYKDSANVDLAKDYMAFASMDEEAAAINLKYGLFSAYKPSHKTAAYSEVDEYFGVAVGETFAQWVDAPIVDFGAYYTDVQAEWKVAQGEILLNGKEPAQALSEASERAQRKIDANS